MNKTYKKIAISSALAFAVVGGVTPVHADVPVKTLNANVRDTVIPLKVSNKLYKPAKAVYTAKSKLSAEDLKNILSEAGFSGKALKLAWATAMKESTGRPLAHNKNSRTGDNSYGLFQINMIGSLGPARLEQYNLKTNSDLFDPLTNAKIAFQMSDKGTDWSAWHGITESTKEWLLEYPN